MMCLSGLVGLLLVLTTEATVGNSSSCIETEECLLFDVICTTGDFEVRHYDSVKWVSTNETSLLMDIAAMKAFWRLFDYISGNNDKGKKIEMTSPVVMRIPQTDFFEYGVFTLSFLLPAEYQTDIPPNPTNNLVYIHDTPDMNVYVRSYSGWMTCLSDKYTKGRLSTDLDSIGANYKKDFHYGAGYNSPKTLFNRHNEVWLVAEGEPVCSTSD
ncbi:putative heme-binding protein 2-like [Scophthalmus maximus]|uniref:Heme-binding protein 1 n=1 Tax=Scophthalmus maximus TaxID=52904 RepID=A0A2U9CX70_SCOMX|nr:heme-binding protein 2 [Scophthalmus maximus]AWP19092.1 putative heme-binding protein 2-like [Scophthalmus maximus]